MTPASECFGSHGKSPKAEPRLLRLLLLDAAGAALQRAAGAAAAAAAALGARRLGRRGQQVAHGQHVRRPRERQQLAPRLLQRRGHLRRRALSRTGASLPFKPAAELAMGANGVHVTSSLGSRMDASSSV